MILNKSAGDPQYLDLGRTGVSDVARLVGLVALRHLDPEDTEVSNVSPLLHISGLLILGP
jgi:hypothetical protein